MVERLKFEGVDHQVVVNLDDPHTMHEAAIYHIDQHKPVVGFESDDGSRVSDVLAKLVQHRFSCTELPPIEIGRRTY